MNNIVLIDDNFALRQVIKSLLKHLSDNYNVVSNVFSTSNGVEGLGFIYITAPEIIIIDTTLPKYSGREVVDFLVKNPKFYKDNIKVIVLQEEQKKLVLPKHFFLINKDDPKAFQMLIRVLTSCMGFSDKSYRPGIFGKLAATVFRNSNKDDLVNRDLRNSSFLRSIFLRAKWIFSGVLNNLLLTIILLIYGRPDDANIVQKNIDIKAYRTKYYPTLIVSIVSFLFISINLSILAITQYSLYKDRQQEVNALATLTVNSVLDEGDATAGDGVCDIIGSSGTGPCTLRAAIEEANETEDAVDVAFNIKDQVSTISTTDEITVSSSQRKTVYDTMSSAYWVFFYNGSGIEYAYSKDEAKWSTAGVIPYDTSAFAIFYYMNMAEVPNILLVIECNNYDICIRNGEMDNTSITFSDEEIVFDGNSPNDNYTAPVVSTSGDGHVWVAARKNTTNGSGNKFNNAIVRRSSDIGVWDAWEAPETLELSSGNSGDLALVGQTGEDMVLISGNNSNNISAWKYDGSEWIETSGEYDFLTFPSGVYIDGNSINVILAHNDYIYLGGEFTETRNADGTSGGQYVTRYNTITGLLEPLGNGTTKGVNGRVDALAIAGNYLYVGGLFTTAYASPSDLTVNNITRINISSASNSFEALGNGLTKGLNSHEFGGVNALVTISDYLYIGGWFTTAYASPSDLTVNSITRINTSSASNSFEALGNGSSKGVNGNVNALAAADDYLYIGGWFTTAYASPSDLTVNNIARINVSSPANSFEAIGNGSTKGLTSEVNALTVANGHLYIGGRFASAYASPSNLDVNHITRINISSPTNSFEALSDGLTKGLSDDVNTLTTSGDYVYIGGLFEEAFGPPLGLDVYYVTRINSSSASNPFEALGNGASKGVGYHVRALAPSGEYLYIGGTFTNVHASPSNLRADRITRINISSSTNSFEVLGNDIKGITGPFASVNALAVSDNYLYLGGEFTTAFTSSATLAVNNITRINLTSTSNSFEAIGNGTTKGLAGKVNALVVSGDYLYIGGEFTIAYASPSNLTVNRITRINTSSASNSFEALGNAASKGVSNIVYALAESNNYVYIGGTFTSAFASPSNLTVNRIARINTSSASNSFEAIGNGSTKGVTGEVSALAIVNDYLYIGGGFATAYASPSDLTVNNITRVNTSSAGNSFEAIGNGSTKGVSGFVKALGIKDDYLYIGGGFTTAYASPSDLTVNHITRINISSPSNSFEALGNGATKGLADGGGVFALATSGDYLYIGGSISTAYASPSNLDIRNITRINVTSPSNPFEYLGDSSINGVNSLVKALAVSDNYIYIGGQFDLMVNRPSTGLGIYAPTISGNTGDSRISSTTDGNGNIYLTYAKSADSDLYFKSMNAETSQWSEEVKIHEGTVSSQSLYYDLPNNKLTVMYIEDSKLYYKQAASPFGIEDWDTTGTLLDTGPVSNISAGEGLSADYPFATYMKGTSSPYQVSYAVLGSPGVKSIRPLPWPLASALPTITNDQVSIDASTQPGADCNSHDLKIKLDGITPELVGSGLAFDQGLVSKPPSIVKGFYINNYLSGINIYPSINDLQILCSVIGLDENGEIQLNGSGISIQSGSFASIGGDSEEERNIISGNYHGVLIAQGAAASISGNYIGTDKAGESARQNDVGIFFSKWDTDTTIGGIDAVDPDNGCTGSCNLISGNTFGIRVHGNVATNSLFPSINILGNFIGTDKSGASAIPNETGLSVVYADGVNIGGESVLGRNIISGNTENGIQVKALIADGTEMGYPVVGLTIQNNYIGTTANGSSALGNGANGIALLDYMPDALITGNTISGNTQNGIYSLFDYEDIPTDSMSILANKIGTKPDGTGNLGNGAKGIELMGKGEITIGAVGQGNIIKNSGDGIKFNDPPSLAIPEGPPSSNLTGTISYNTISDNSNNGLLLYGNGIEVNNNTFTNNTISGIRFIVGQDVDIIENNISQSSVGILLPAPLSPSGANMSKNIITLHPAIRLGGSRNINDENDIDIGENHRQNYPELTSAEVSSDSKLYGTFNSEANTYYRIEAFGFSTLPLTEPITESYIGSTIIQTDGSGNFDFSATPLTIAGLPGEGHENITTTATKCNDSSCSDPIETSELSDGVTAAFLTPTDTPNPTPTETPVPTDTPLPSDTPTPTATPGPLLWHSTMDNAAALTNPVLGTGMTNLEGLTYETSGGRTGTAFLDAGDSASTTPNLTDYNILKGEIEYWFKPSIPSTTGSTSTHFLLRNGAQDEYIRFRHEGTNLVASYKTTDATRSVTIDNANYNQHWSVGEWLYISIRWDSTIEEGANGDRLRIFINGVEPTHTDTGTMDSANMSAFNQFIIGNLVTDGTQRARGTIDEFKIWLSGPQIEYTPTPTLTNTPSPTPIPTATDTPIPTPIITPVPTTTNTTVPTAAHIVPTNTAVVLPTDTIQPSIEEASVTPTLEVTTTASVTPTPTSVTQQPTPTVTEPYKSIYVPPEESIINLPIVQSVSISIAKTINSIKESSPIAGSVLQATIGVSERIKPITDNLSYLLSLQFIGSRTAIAGITSINLLALAAPAVAANFAQPRVLYYALAWFWKRKSRNPWGIVIDKITSSPIAFARVIVMKDGKTVQTQTTDLQGKYGFVLDKGIYQVYISHSDYLDYSDEIQINFDGQILSKDFELSPKNHDDFGSSMHWGFYQTKKFVKGNLFILNTIIFSTGFVYTLFAVTNALTVLNYAILSLYLLQILLIAVFYFTRDREWGDVLDLSTGTPVAGAIVRLFNNERQLDVAITDMRGRYNFLLDPGTYYLKVSASGFIFPPDNTPNIITNKTGEKMLKFTLQDPQRLNLKLYMQRYAHLDLNKQAILSPFN